MDNQISATRGAKTWQMALFTMNNAATNTYLFLIGYVSYYATGIAGLGVAIIGIISTFTRLWDGITDPIIGAFIDKTNGKFGKFRPFMVLGNIILAIMVLVIFGTVHLVPENIRLVYYILCYMVYIIGYTFQTACTKAGQACLTNDPKQRPTFTLFDTIWNCIVWAVLPIIASGPLYNWAGGFTEKFFMTFCALTIVLSGIFTVLAVIGIWSHDRTEYFNIQDENAPKLSFKEYFKVFKENRAIQMLVIAASSDKLTSTVKTSSVLMVVLFGIYMGSYDMYGTISSIVIIPSILVASIGTAYAAKKGMKRALWDFTILDMLTSGIILVMILFNPEGIPAASVLGVVFLFVYSVLYCLEYVSSGIVIPMIADCADYETYRSGLYIPGMMGTMFSFIDKLISSLGTTIISLGLAFIGFTKVQPVAEDPLTPALLSFLVIMYVGMPMIGWILNLIALKFYPLTKEKMAEIQETLARLKSEKQ